MGWAITVSISQSQKINTKGTKYTKGEEIVLKVLSKLPVIQKTFVTFVSFVV
jgi:hypothetical protein